MKQLIDRLKPFPLDKDVLLYCDDSTKCPRPYVPSAARHSIFESLHNISHPSIKATVKLVKERYFWPGMDKNVREWSRNCLACQQSKIHRHTKSQILDFNLSSDRFETVHLDIVGPLPMVKVAGDPYFKPQRYLLTCIDRSTRWIEATPLSDITATTIASAFIETWISRCGVPLRVVTDRGAQFEAELFAELAKLVGFHRLRTTAYHPQANGMIERAHRTIKTAVMARKEGWLQALPMVLLGIRSLPNESGFSPFTAVTGANLLLPRPLITETNENCSKETTTKLQEIMGSIDF